MLRAGWLIIGALALIAGFFLLYSGIGELYFLDVCKSSASCPVGPSITPPADLATIQMDSIAFAIFGGVVSLVGLVLVMAGLGRERWAVPTTD